MADSNDYARVANLYDSYVRTTFDVPFFLNEAKKTKGQVLELMSGTGRFICTLHNPPVRLKKVDGQLRFWGKFPLEKDQGLLLLWLQEEFAADRRTVNVLEFLEEYDAHGLMQSRTLLEMAYCPIRRTEFEQLAESSGFRALALYGSYEYAEFQEETSPSMIWLLEKAKAG